MRNLLPARRACLCPTVSRHDDLWRRRWHLGKIGGLQQADAERLIGQALDSGSIFADSKRPGHIAEPYRDAQSFIDDYQRYRAHTIVTFRELPSYQKQRRGRALRSTATSNK